MNLRRLPATLDTIFVFTAAFAAAFTVMRYYVKVLWAAIAVGLLLGAGLATVYSLLRAKKNAVYALKRMPLQIHARLHVKTLAHLEKFFRIYESGIEFFHGQAFLELAHPELHTLFISITVHEGVIHHFQFIPITQSSVRKLL